jgi:dihydrofolate reductase
MSQLVLKMSMSLDGYVAPPDGSGEWAVAGRSPDSGAWLLDTVSGARAHLLGAETYRHFTTFWPAQTGPVADAMNTIPKVVFSNSLETADWPESTIERGELAESVARVKAAHGGDGYVLAQAGTRFAQSLVATGLIDEYRLAVHPVVLGAGDRLFSAPLDLEPVSTTAFSGGIAVHVFRAR